MARLFLGEHDVVIRGRCYMLRPTFSALHIIEQQSGIVIPKLIEQLDQREDIALIRLVINEGLRAAYDDVPKLPQLRRKHWLALHEDAVQFLIHGLGYVVDADEQAHATVLLDALPDGTDDPKQRSRLFDNAGTTTSGFRFDPIDWRQCYKTATGLFGKSDTEFWQMTMCGLMLQSESYIVSQGVEVAEVGLPASLAELHAMMEQFPDVPATMQ